MINQAPEYPACPKNPSYIDLISLYYDPTTLHPALIRHKRDPPIHISCLSLRPTPKFAVTGASALTVSRPWLVGQATVSATLIGDVQSHVDHLRDAIHRW
jgi:hypothetical protein